MRLSTPSKSSRCRTDSLGQLAGRKNVREPQRFSAELLLQWLRNNGHSEQTPPGVFICDNEKYFPGLPQALESRGWIRNTDLESPIYHLKFTLNPDEKGAKGAANAVVNHTNGIKNLCRKRIFYRHLRERCLARCDCEWSSFFPRAFDLSDTKDAEDLRGDFYLTKAACVLQHYVASAGLFASKGLAASKAVARRHLMSREEECLDSSSFVESGRQSRVDSSNKSGVDFVVTPDEAQELDAVRLNGSQVLPASQHDADCKALEKTVEERDLLSRLSKMPDTQAHLQGQTAANWWILKPGELSRSSGIQVVGDDLSYILRYRGGNYVCQKYIERPLLIKGRKQDIRQLVFAVDMDKPEGGQCYFYPEVYSYFALRQHKMDGAPDEHSHVTGMQAYDTFDTAMYQAWLMEHCGRDVWPEIQAQMRQIVVRTLRCVQEDLVMEAASDFARQSADDGPNQMPQRHCEILGYDFEVDEDLNVWLLEVNEMPSLHYTSPIKDRIVRGFIEDCVKVVVDNNGDIGKFQRLNKWGEQMQNESCASEGALGQCPLAPPESRNLPLQICGRSLSAAGNAMLQPARLSASPTGDGVGWKWRHAQQMMEYKLRQEKNKLRKEREQNKLSSLQHSATRRVLRSLSVPALSK